MHASFTASGIRSVILRRQQKGAAMIHAAMLVVAIFLAQRVQTQTLTTAAQSSSAAPTQSATPSHSRRALAARRVANAVSIDGSIDEPVWRDAEVARDFVQQRPTPGAPASERTEVRVLYTDEAIYVGAAFDADGSHAQAAYGVEPRAGAVRLVRHGG
jgi:hypothetical protein